VSSAPPLPEILQWQFHLTWRLAEVHLPVLTDEMCLWEPAAPCWSVRRGSDGAWQADWADMEPDPLPVLSIGWITWHLIWWWSSLLAAVQGGKPLPHDRIAWPGSAAATVGRLRELSASWTEALAKFSDTDLERPLAYPWPEPRPLKFALARTNSELMKNVAENRHHSASVRRNACGIRPDIIIRSKGILRARKLKRSARRNWFAKDGVKQRSSAASRPLNLFPHRRTIDAPG
jgi:hypothetical protein